jgi:alpha-D-xyloside xylohydrolase
MFVRAGSILPLAPVMQYASEQKWDQLEIVVYPGADGEFTLYEDEGDGYAYEQGQYSTIQFSWNEARKQLTIGARKGSFPGMLSQRTFNVRIVGKDGTKTVRYTGTETMVK